MRGLRRTLCGREPISLGKKRGWALLLIPVLWVALEYARGQLLSGFPWAALAYSQYRFLPLIQIADLASIYGVGFLIVLVNVGLFEAIREGWLAHRMAWRELILAGGLFLLSLGYGLYRLDQPMGEERSVTVAVVQGNIEQDQKWEARLRDETVQKYKRLSLDSVEKGNTPPELIVWPESAAPFFFRRRPPFETSCSISPKKENSICSSEAPPSRRHPRDRWRF
ncbi:MAG: hypothetical protein MPW15_00825 [Candidatus Manganitrophus sp.]|nr:hypothetical protein [Candidatus Manganitrophus sp.]